MVSDGTTMNGRISTGGEVKAIIPCHTDNSHSHLVLIFNSEIVVLARQQFLFQILCVAMQLEGCEKSNIGVERAVCKDKIKDKY